MPSIADTLQKIENKETVMRRAVAIRTILGFICLVGTLIYIIYLIGNKDDISVQITQTTAGEPGMTKPQLVLSWLMFLGMLLIAVALVVLLFLPSTRGFMRSYFSEVVFILIPACTACSLSGLLFLTKQSAAARMLLFAALGLVILMLGIQYVLFTGKMALDAFWESIGKRGENESPEDFTKRIVKEMTLHATRKLGLHDDENVDDFMKRLLGIPRDQSVYDFVKKEVGMEPSDKSVADFLMRFANKVSFPSFMIGRGLFPEHKKQEEATKRGNGKTHGDVAHDKGGAGIMQGVQDTLSEMAGGVVSGAGGVLASMYNAVAGNNQASAAGDDTGDDDDDTKSRASSARGLSRESSFMSAQTH